MEVYQILWLIYIYIYIYIIRNRLFFWKSFINMSGLLARIVQSKCILKSLSKVTSSFSCTCKFIIIIFTLCDVFTASLNYCFFFHWIRSDCKTLWGWALLRILDDFNSTVVWMVSILPLISMSHRFFSKSFCTFTRVPITVGFFVTFMPPRLYILSGKIQVFFFSAIFYFHYVVFWNGLIY